MNIRSILSGMVLSTVGLLATTADAATQFRIEGQVCVGSTINEWGAVNLSASAATVFCPVVTDEVKSPINLKVLVWDRNDAAAVSCWLRSKQPGGTITTTGPVSTTVAGHSGGLWTLTFTPIIGLGLSVQCSLPGTDPGAGTGTNSGLSHIVMSYSN